VGPEEVDIAPQSEHHTKPFGEKHPMFEDPPLTAQTGHGLLPQAFDIEVI
jgi:hypothetical protein